MPTFGLQCYLNTSCYWCIKTGASSFYMYMLCINNSLSSVLKTQAKTVSFSPFIIDEWSVSSAVGTNHDYLVEISHPFQDKKCNIPENWAVWLCKTKPVTLFCIMNFLAPLVYFIFFLEKIGYASLLLFCFLFLTHIQPLHDLKL